MKGLPETLDLSRVGIDPAGITKVDLIHEKDGAYLYRVQCDWRSVVIKWFVDAPGSIEIRSYALLKTLRVPTLPVHGRSDNALVLEDLTASKDWRPATEADYQCSNVGRAVAMWYRQLHQAGRKFLSQTADPTGFLRREEAGLDAGTILTIGEKLGLSHLPVWRLCADHIEPLKRAIRAQATTLTYNDFHWSNLAVTYAKVKPVRAVMFDFHLLGIGMAYSDCRNVLSCLRASAADAFKEAYGLIDEREAVLDAPVAILVALQEAASRPRLPRWAEGLVRKVTGGELERALQKALDRLHNSSGNVTRASGSTLFQAGDCPLHGNTLTERQYMRYGLVDYESRNSDRVSFPVQSSVLDEEALLSRVAKDYRIPTPDSCRFLTRGDADIYRLKTATGNFYLKVYRPPHSLELAEAEASFVLALSASGIPVVKPIPRTDGRFAFRACAPEGTRPMLLFEEAPPPLPSQLDEALLTQIGETVALVHAAADEFDTDFGVPAIACDAFLKERVYYTSHFLSEQDTAYLCDVSRTLGLILQQLPDKTPDFGLCHGDIVMSNLRLTTEGTVTLFDFGNTLKTWRAFELAIVYWSLGNRYRDCRDHLWKTFLQGYEAIRPLPEALTERLAVMLILRQIAFLGGNCATLPLRLGTEPFESTFMEAGIKRLRTLVDNSGIPS